MNIPSCFGALCAFFLLLAAAPGTEERPNIILCLVDELGWADVPWHGSEYRMPQAERYARLGLRLEANYVHPMCSPTRCALLSGRYASRFGVTAAQNEQAMPFGTATTASVLKSAGYATALIGKWHLGSKPEQGPQKFGFDFGYGSLAGGCSSYSHRYKEGEFTHTWHRNGELIEEEGHVTDLFAREAVHWIEQRGPEPFFLYLPFTAIHIPIEEPSRWLAMNAHLGDPGERLRAACTSHMDDAFGQIMAAVERSGKAAQTLVVYMGDNGAHKMMNNFDRKFPGQFPDVQVGHTNAPLRGYKTEVYEGGFRVPAFVYWPGKIKPGLCSVPIAAPDWLPTFAARAHIAPGTLPPGLDGLDVWPWLTQPDKPAPLRLIYTAAPAYKARSVRQGDWKLIETKSKSSNGTGKLELYDLAHDPGEQTNLAAQESELVTQLQQRLAEFAAGDAPETKQKSE